TASPAPSASESRAPIQTAAKPAGTASSNTASNIPATPIATVVPASAAPPSARRSPARIAGITRQQQASASSNAASSPGIPRSLTSATASLLGHGLSGTTSLRANEGSLRGATEP